MNPLRGSCVSERSRFGAVRTFYVADETSAGIVRVGALSLWRRANFLRGRRTLCGDRACRSALAAAPCELSTWPTNPLRGSCVSERSRCGAVRICTLADEPSAGIVRVGALSLRRRANFLRGRRTLCGDRACRSALAVAPCELSTWPTNPLRGSCVSERSRCGGVRTFYVAAEPSAGIARVGALSLVAPCKLSTWPTNPLQGSCVSERSRCGAVRICTLADEPFAGIVRSLWRRAHLHACRRTLCGDRACRSALAVAPCELSESPTNPLRRSCVSERSRCGAVRTFYVADKPSARIVRVGFALAVAPCEFARWPMNPLRGWCVSDRSRCGFR